MDRPRLNAWLKLVKASLCSHCCPPIIILTNKLPSSKGPFKAKLRLPVLGVLKSRTFSGG